MYRKDSESWLKHADFIILDMICLQLAYVLAYIIRLQGICPYGNIIYRNMAVFLELADLLVIFTTGTHEECPETGTLQRFYRNTEALCYCRRTGAPVSVHAPAGTCFFETDINTYNSPLFYTYICGKRTLEKSSPQKDGRWRSSKPAYCCLQG